MRYYLILTTRIIVSIVLKRSRKIRPAQELQEVGLLYRFKEKSKVELNMKQWQFCKVGTCNKTVPPALIGPLGTSGEGKEDGTQE